MKVVKMSLVALMVSSSVFAQDAMNGPASVELKFTHKSEAFCEVSEDGTRDALIFISATPVNEVNNYGDLSDEYYNSITVNSKMMKSIKFKSTQSFTGKDAWGGQDPTSSYQMFNATNTSQGVGVIKAQMSQPLELSIAPEDGVSTLKTSIRAGEPTHVGDGEFSATVQITCS